MDIPCIYIKKAFRQKLKSKHNTTSAWASIASHSAPLQINNQGTKNVLEAYNIKPLDVLCPNFLITTKDKFKKMNALHSKWLYKDNKEIVKGAELAAC